MTLALRIQELTSAHLTTGPRGPAEVPALLDQLAGAAFPNKDGAAGGGATGQPVPVNLDAIKLWQDLERNVRLDIHEMTAQRATGTLSRLIQSIPGAANDEWTAFWEHALLDWCDRIRGLLYPAPPRRKLDQACPACSTARTLVWEDSAEGYVWQAAVTVGCWGADGKLKAPSEWDARCGECGAEWAGETMDWLVRAIAA